MRPIIEACSNPDELVLDPFAGSGTTCALARKLGADENLVVPVQTSEVNLPAPRPLRCGLKTDKVKKLLGESVPLPLDAQLDRFLAERRA